MTYLVHINPTPGSDLRVVEVEADNVFHENGVIAFTKETDDGSVTVAMFSPAVWNYVEPKK